MGYGFWLSAEATHSLLGSDNRTRLKMELALQRLAAAPFTEPDFREPAPSGRIYDVMVDMMDDAAGWRILRVKFSGGKYLLGQGACWSDEMDNGCFGF